MILLFTLYGVVSGFVLTRLERTRKRQGRASVRLRLLGWFLCAVSLAIASAGLGYAAWEALATM